jgi:hypothetical protein
MHCLDRHADSRLIRILRTGVMQFRNVGNYSSIPRGGSRNCGGATASSEISQTHITPAEVSVYTSFLLVGICSNGLYSLERVSLQVVLRLDRGN